jgi:hypothetical protein
MPTLPGLTERTPATARSNWMWVCALTSTRSSTPASAARMRASGVANVISSSSLRGDPWQKRVGPNPSISTTAP